MKRILKKAFLISGIILLLVTLFIVIASLVFFYKKSVIKGMFERYLANKAGVPIEIGHLDYELFPLRVDAHSIRAKTKIAQTEIDVHLNRLSAQGVLKRLWKKTDPLFDSVKIEGAKAHVQIAMAGKKIDIQKILLCLSQSSNYVRNLNLKDASLHLTFPSQNIHLQSLEISLQSSQRDGKFLYSLSCEKASGGVESRHIGFDISLRSAGVISLSKTPFIEGQFSLRPVGIHFLEKSFALDEILFNLRLEYKQEEDIFLFPQLKLKVPPLFSLSGTLTLHPKEGFSILLSSQIKAEDIGVSLDLLRPYLPPQFGGLNVKGEAAFKGEVRFVKGHSGREMAIDGQLSFGPLSMKYAKPHFSAKTFAQGTFGIRGPVSALDVTGLLKTKDGNLSLKNIECQGVSLQVPVSFKKTDSTLKINPFQASLQELTLTLKEKRTVLKDLSLQARSEVELEKRKIHLIDLDFQLPSLLSISAKAKTDFNLKGQKWIFLKSEKISLKRLLEVIPLDLPKELANWAVNGEINLEMESWNLPQLPDEKWEVTGKMSLANLSFHNPPFTFASEGLSPQLMFGGNADTSLENISFHLSLELPKGETLWNETYLNWDKVALTTKIRGKFQPKLHRFGDLLTEIFLTPLGKISIQGSLDLKPSLSMDFSISVSELNLQSLYSLLPQRQASALSSFELAGRLKSQIRMKKEKNALSLRGHIQMEEVVLEHKEKKFALNGIEGYIPFYYASGVSSNPEEEEYQENGYVLIKEIQLPNFSLSPLRLSLHSDKNKILIEALRLDIFGGNALLGNSLILLSSRPSEMKGFSSFVLSDIDFRRLPLPSEKIPLSGKAQLKFPRIEITPTLLDTEGRAHINIFEGEVTIANMKIEKPFSPMRTISCDVNFSGLNLKKVTDMLPFGQVTGIIKGEIKDLSFSFGQPESFILRLESEQRKGIPQKFSLKAANDIAILSSGDKTSLTPGKGWTRFVSDFRYKKIGVFCSLKNDLFNLRGTIREKGVEYLVKGDWLFGINVINKKPQNQIRFKDMLSRLKRIGHSRELP